MCNQKTKEWTVIGKNSCTPPPANICDHSEAEDNSSNDNPFFKYGEVNCQKGKSCSLQCNNFKIQGALTCKQGQWIKRKKNHHCCLEADKPEIENGVWRCKEKKYTQRCQLRCTNGVKINKVTAHMSCGADGWNVANKKLSCRK